MSKQQNHTNTIKQLRIQLEIANAERDLSHWQFVHLNRLQAYNERIDTVRPRVKEVLSMRLEHAEDMILESNQALRKAKAKYKETHGISNTTKEAKA